MTNGQAYGLEFRTRFAVDDGELSRLHARAFEGPLRVLPWAARLDRHALTWIGALATPS